MILIWSEGWNINLEKSLITQGGFDLNKLFKTQIHEHFLHDRHCSKCK